MPDLHRFIIFFHLFKTCLIKHALFGVWNGALVKKLLYPYTVMNT